MNCADEISTRRRCRNHNNRQNYYQSVYLFCFQGLSILTKGIMNSWNGKHVGDTDATQLTKK